MVDKLKTWVEEHKAELSIYGLAVVYLIFCYAIGLGFTKLQARVWAKTLAGAIL